VVDYAGLKSKRKNEEDGWDIEIPLVRMVSRIGEGLLMSRGPINEGDMLEAEFVWRYLGWDRTGLEFRAYI
jgi:hypothetical protein